MFEKLVAMVAEQLGVNAADVKPESRLKEDLQADSASIMMLVMDVETEFGIEVEDEYVHSISKSFSDVYGKNKSWYFLRSLRGRYDAKPWVAYDDGDRSVVCIADTLSDHFWQTINTTRDDEEFIKKIADEIITEDGKSGEMIEVMNRRGYPVLITHWQSLISNGLGTGIRALDEVGRRINALLGDKVEWMSFEEIMNMVLEDKENYPKPVFESNRR